jgi:DNA-binding transcriptional regulator of glucitol operon
MTATVIIIALAFMWTLQYLLTFRQMQRFYRRIARLRRDGVLSVGMAGSTWRRKQYAVLVVDQHYTIVHAEQLSGWTVFAKLKPIRGLAGQPMSRLWNDDLKPSMSSKLLRALRDASDHIQKATAVESVPAT